MFTLADAKKYFIKCGCSHFHLSREGNYEAYLAMGISKEQELEWLGEYRAGLLERFDAGGIQRSSVIFYLFSISDYRDYDAIQPLMDRIEMRFDKLDSFTKVLIGENLLRLCKCAGRKNDHPMVPIAKALARRLFEHVVTNGIVFAGELGIHDAEPDGVAPLEILEWAKIGLTRLDDNVARVRKSL